MRPPRVSRIGREERPGRPECPGVDTLLGAWQIVAASAANQVGRNPSSRPGTRAMATRIRFEVEALGELEEALKRDQVLVELPVDQDFSPTTQNMK